MRRGADVLKARALGAERTLVGRPFPVWAGGRTGRPGYLRGLRG
ncbi:alpha-hydroxy-acid oxidizing protein [Brevundimonas diminuta]